MDIQLTPFNDPLWNENDQQYWINMVVKYRYPVLRVRAPFKEIIEQGRIDTWRLEFMEYQEAMAAQVTIETA